ncbi:MAG: adenylate/guanylate cyclase domain-containing protein [Spirochaetia bacterium]|jgi:class 3 adenylate cyclase
MESPFEGFLGKKIGSTRVVPLVTKIVLIFSIFILVSNLMTNYINLMFNRTELIKLTEDLLVKDLKETYTFASTQFDIYQFTHDLAKSTDTIEQYALRDLKASKAITIGIKPDGSLLFQALRIPRLKTFPDAQALARLDANRSSAAEGSLSFALSGSEYFGVYKYNEKWDMFILRAEELGQLYQSSRQIFLKISLIILLISLIIIAIGIILIRYILRYVGLITNAIMKMRNDSQMEIIDLARAPNDEITFLGVALNALSSSVNNLVTIFRKFVSKDIAVQAYREKQIRLEGARRELTILFSDIRSFTAMTETLGTDIIKLLNIHYEQAISAVVRNDGIIGSLIGDAVLAVYGTFPESRAKKSLQAITSAYLIQDNAAELRVRMEERRETILKQRGSLSREEERIYRAVLLKVGVGIDGGDVFYGNIGSQERMTNTVIGDNVNAASRLEGLTRLYNVPVICSGFVKDDVEAHFSTHGIRFIEIDRVQVKGKTEGKWIYWAIPEEITTPALEKALDIFSRGLRFYVDGDWTEAHKRFSRCTLAVASVFKERTKGGRSPKEWNGTWTMRSK